MENELTISNLMNALFKNLKQIIIITLLGLITSLAFSIIFVEPKYNSEAQIVIKDNSAGASVTNDIQRVYTYKDMIKSNSMLSKIKKELSNKYNIIKTKSELKSLIKVNQEQNSLIISMSVIDRNPKTAQKIVKVVVKQFIKYGENYSKADTLKIQSKPSLPEKPESSRVKLVFAGTLTFFVIACILVIYQYTKNLEVESTNSKKNIDEINRGALGSANRLKRKDIREFSNTNNLKDY